MTGGVFTIEIQAPPEKVWSWVSDLDRHAEWSPKPYRVEWVSGEPNAVGSRFRSVGWIPSDKDHTNEGEITQSDPPKRFALRADDTDGAYPNSFELEPVGDGRTRVMFSLEFPAQKGMNAAVVPILFPLVGKPQIRKRMELLKQKVEGSA